MGGCATKPKNLKADTEEAPAPAPEENAGTVIETKEVLAVDSEKLRSLSNLFKEKEVK